MYRFWIATAVVSFGSLGACGHEDDRPATLEYVTSAILAPSCANAQCHSAFRQVKGYAFDTIEHARTSLSLRDFNETPDDPDDDYAAVIPGMPDESLLYLVLVRTTVDGEFPRMPYDQPMPGPNIELVRQWIVDGAPGLELP